MHQFYILGNTSILFIVDLLGDRGVEGEGDGDGKVRGDGDGDGRGAR